MTNAIDARHTQVAEAPVSLGAPTAIERIARFVSSVDPADMDDLTIRAAARAFADTFAVSVGARRDPLTGVLRTWTAGEGGAGTIWAGVVPAGCTEERAAHINAAMAHVLDFDDASTVMRGHPSAVLFPAIVAVGESSKATGREVSAAYSVGFEVWMKIARAVSTEHYKLGWHATATLGTIAAAAAVSNLLRLSETEVARALGIAVSQASGTRQAFGTMAKSYQVGAAAAAGLQAARLAQAGLTSSPDALDAAEAGFLALYCVPGARELLDAHLATLGEAPGELLARGVEVKRFPLCYATHRAIALALELREEHSLNAEDIVRVEVETNAHGMEPLIHHRPMTGLEAKFSMEFAVAAALIDGAVRLRSFDTEDVQRPEIQALLRRVVGHEGPGDLNPRWTTMTIQTRDGAVITRTMHDLKGSAQQPLDDTELLAKVVDCYQYAGLEADDGRRFATTCLDWADVDIRELVRSSGVA
ncbi:MmgE/PrpD family protein [Nocardioides sp. KIGAM211]|uniref:MmgE/PrpD family protein n=1 Tax=Nocardioides luti TaxID=2761101 RepID=A0A7X0VAB1_9ACTN|nr:MmgE/PrpD family protein [Nocardioides luti]MBB6627569.1 MmgE/PrpD family protein [Nocardioides luti]